MKLLKSLLAVSILGIASLAHAGPIEMDVKYLLGNHPDGGAADPLYGLRLDGLLTGNTTEVYTFDFDADGVQMMMYWDSVTGELRIWGTASGGQDIGTAYDPNTTADWTIEFTYSGLYACGDNICSDTGSGTVSSGEYGSFDLVAVGKLMHGYTFKLDGDHRGYDGTSGYGWMNHCEGGDNPDSVTGGSCDTHMYASDWLFTATKVSEPGTLALLGLGLFGLGLSRRKK